MIPKKAKCKQCKTEYQKSNSLQKVCSTKCAVSYGRSERERKEKSKHLTTKRKFLANDVSHQKKKAQTAFNAFIRERDKNLGCVSCGKPKDWNGQWHAGHFYTVGARSDLRFNEDNCHKQCSVCNNYLSANLVNYLAEIVKRIGKKRFEALERVEIAKLTASDYSEITKTYKRKLKEITEV